MIEETPSSLVEYLQLYRDAGAELRKNRGEAGNSEHESVHATFSLGFEKVATGNSVAADLLGLCAFFAPDQIPEESFIEGAPDLGECFEAALFQMLSVNAHTHPELAASHGFEP